MTLSVNCGKHFMCDESSPNDASQVCIPEDYRIFQRPNKFGRIKVEASFIVEQVVKIDQDVITMSGFLNTKWNDPRLVIPRNYGRDAIRSSHTSETYVPQNIDLINHIWQPDLYFYRFVNFVAGKGEGLWISTTGTVIYSKAMEISFRCLMDLRRYPLDSHDCKFFIGSYTQNDRKMVFDTFESDDIYSDQETYGSLSDFVITPKQPLDKVDRTLVTKSLGNFSLTGFQMKLTRRVSSYITSFYLPSSMAVLLCWLSFLLPVQTGFRSVARIITISISITILAILCSSEKVMLSSVECLTALQVWFVACFALTFAVLVQTVILLFKRQKNCVRTLTVDNMKYESAGNGSNPPNEDLYEDEFWKIDKQYFVIFPAIFLIFNLAYWLAYSL